MNLFDQFISKARNKRSNIGIGLGESESHNRLILNASLQFINDSISNVYFFGTPSSIDNVSRNNSYQKMKKRIILIKSHEPEQEIIEQLGKNVIHGAVRGALSSSTFLNDVKKYFKTSEIYRLALLETDQQIQFFFGPVGIDECNNYERKISFIKKAISELMLLNISPNISILSGGRRGDIGRNDHVDETIKTAEEVLAYFKRENPSLMISHDEILIENAIEKKKNLIIAPDGISGNLIYRTLVHLGGGKAHGAIYMGLNKTIIDTSRVGHLSEIHGALLMALALAR